MKRLRIKHIKRELVSFTQVRVGDSNSTEINKISASNKKAKLRTKSYIPITKAQKLALILF